jgi:hypothetical protein
MPRLSIRKTTPKLFFTRFVFSFPIQLFIVLLKKNQLLLLYWVILFGFITGNIASRFGIHYLFLDPEYSGSVGWWSFFVIGMMCGAFIMVFNISSYITNAYTFPFIASLARPFMKYTINNFIVPLLFILVYFYELWIFQRHSEFESAGTILIQYAGFITGMALIMTITLAYFFRTSLDIVRMFGMKAADADVSIPLAEHVGKMSSLRQMLKFKRKLPWRVDTYLSTPLKVKLVRHTGHYSKQMFDSVIRQNHLNAALVEIFVFVMFILLGLFREYKLFQIPAGASLFLLFSMFIMLTSAFRFWVREWAATAFIVLFILFNYFSQFDFAGRQNKVYGLQYPEKKKIYKPYGISTFPAPSKVTADSMAEVAALEHWKEKFIGETEKPKLILINVSGGGLRACMWTFRVLQFTDSITGGKMMEHARLITGASGGMIGAAYYRELSRQQKLGMIPTVNNTTYIENISSDLLNPVGVSLVVNDLFFNMQKFSLGNQRYNKDRAYAFEKYLNNTTDNVLNKTLSDYFEEEKNAVIPLMILTPAIVNDGKRVIISSLPVSYLMAVQQKENFNYSKLSDCIEYSDYFKDFGAEDSKFTSLLRMNATFPYVLPAVTLPTEPPVQVMDAGMRDNFGLKTTFRYLFAMQNWIEKNTSGIIIYQVRDTRKERNREIRSRGTILENLVSPIGNFYGNLLPVQEYETDEESEYLKMFLNVPVDLIVAEMPSYEEEISLSWHLTTKEKSYIKAAVHLPANKKSFERLQKLLNVK